MLIRDLRGGIIGDQQSINFSPLFNESEMQRALI